MNATVGKKREFIFPFSPGVFHGEGHWVVQLPPVHHYLSGPTTEGGSWRLAVSSWCLQAVLHSDEASRCLKGTSYFVNINSGLYQALFQGYESLHGDLVGTSMVSTTVLVVQAVMSCCTSIVSMDTSSSWLSNAFCSVTRASLLFVRLMMGPWCSLNSSLSVARCLARWWCKSHLGFVSFARKFVTFAMPHCVLRAGIDQPSVSNMLTTRRERDVGENLL